MRISDWSSDVCSSDLIDGFEVNHGVVSVLDGHYRRSAASAQSEKCALCCKKMLTPTHRGRERASIKPPNIVMKGSSKQPIKSCCSATRTPPGETNYAMFTCSTSIYPVDRTSVE